MTEEKLPVPDHVQVINEDGGRKIVIFHPELEGVRVFESDIYSFPTGSEAHGDEFIDNFIQDGLRKGFRRK